MFDSIFFESEPSDWLIISESPNHHPKQVWVQGTSSKICKTHQWPKLVLLVSIMILNCHAKKMKMSFWRYFMQKNQHSDFQKIMLCQKSKTRLLNCLKQLNQFAVSMNAYHTHKKPHSSSQPWHIANLILEITLSMPSCNLTHPYKWTESYRCI